MLRRVVDGAHLLEAPREAEARDAGDDVGHRPEGTRLLGLQPFV